MKKIIVALLLIVTAFGYSQIKLDTISFKKMETLTGSKEYDNIVELKSYKTSKGDWISIGDTLVVGKPSNQNNLQSNSHVNGKTNNHTYIFLGTTGAVLLGAAFFANENMTGDKMFVTSIKMGRMSKKQPYYVIFEFNKVGGGTFLNIKKLARADIEKAIDSKEILNPKQKISKEDAIKKLKESKDLLDLGIIKQEDFDKLKIELTPIILNKQ